MQHVILSVKDLTRELQQIPSSHSSDIEFKSLMKPYKDYSKEAFWFLVIATTLPSDNPLRFRKKVIIKWLLATK